MENNNTASERPELLRILCILSFIGSGFLSFWSLVTYLGYEKLIELLSQQNQYQEIVDFYVSISKDFFIWSFLLYSASLSGAFLMWRLRKVGFHIYTISQLILLIIPLFFLKSNNFPIFGILLTSLFILLYYKNINHME